MKSNLIMFLFSVVLTDLPQSCFAGQWVTNNTGVVVFNQRVLPDESFTWSGETTNGYAHGSGTLAWFTNDVENAQFTGSLSNGYASGHGVYIAAEGSRGEGNWIKGKREGTWTIKWANGGTYVGDYLHNKRTGRGVEVMVGGSRYEGDFLDSRFHGHGALTWADGNRYEGEFKDSHRTGRGVLTFANGIQYEGEFKDDQFHGLGRLTYPSGKVISGKWTNGQLIDSRSVTDDEVQYERPIANQGVEPTSANAQSVVPEGYPHTISPSNEVGREAEFTEPKAHELNFNEVNFNLVLGKTTKKEVVDVFGIPDKKEAGDGKSEKWTYEFSAADLMLSEADPTVMTLTFKKDIVTSVTTSVRRNDEHTANQGIDPTR